VTAKLRLSNPRKPSLAPVEVSALADTGSVFLCIPQHVYLQLGLEVLQELLHAYLQSDRMTTLDAALDMVDALVGAIWPVEAEDVRFARSLAARHPELEARDLVHLACCRRRGAHEMKTFDRPLAAAFRRK